MRNIWAYILLLFITVTSCKKENDRVFDKSPDERVNELLAKYQDQLDGADNGWKAVITSAKGVNYAFYFKFNDKNRVVMNSDFKGEYARVSHESSYRLKALQQVSLLFDTYSYIHELADPDPNVAGGDLGTGYGVDFEFYFDNATSDTINLVGRKHENKMQMVRATKEEADLYASGAWENQMVTLANYSKILYYWKTIVLNGVTYQVSIDLASRSIVFTWKDASGAVKTVSTSFYYTLKGLGLKEPLDLGGITLKEFSKLEWNQSNLTFRFTFSDGTTSVMSGVNAPPVYVDPNAPSQWYTSPYWASIDGFHRNGIDDYYEVKSLDYFGFIRFYPNGRISNISGDMAAFYMLVPGAAGIYYGPVMTTDTTSLPGRARFRVGSVYGIDFDPVYYTALQFNQANGYYFVKTSDYSYDMVSVADARIWLTWLK